MSKIYQQSKISMQNQETAARRFLEKRESLILEGRAAEAKKEGEAPAQAADREGSGRRGARPAAQVPAGSASSLRLLHGSWLMIVNLLPDAQPKTK